MVYLLALISLVFTHFYHYQAIKIYQLSYYRLNEFIHSLKSKKLAVVLYCVAPVIFLIFALIFPYISVYIALCQLLFSVLVYIYYRKRAKTQIKYTRRLTLFLLLSAIFLVPISIILALCNLSPILVLTYPLCGLISHFIVGWVYAIKNRNYIKKAQEKLKKINPIVIGVVGSYGKTTTKFALTTILKQKYAVKCTRENFNTPLGIARTINENLDENTQVFVMEMGARYKGDIAEICSNFTPDYAVITAVGNQHLDTFKSLETVYQTKGEILDFITDGTVFINGYDDGAKRLCGRAKSKVLVSGSENTASYSNCVTTERGTQFTLNINGKRVEVTSKLIGSYAPATLCLCSLVASELSLTTEQIINGIKLVKSVAHRLELLYNGLDVIIDDSYNANENGVKVALQTLKSMKKTRVVVTPGIVELGSEQAKANYRIGLECARCADYAVFTGVNKAFLENGAIAGGMAKERIKLVATLNQAVEELKKIKGERAILFSNDLPENY